MTQKTFLPNLSLCIKILCLAIFLTFSLPLMAKATEEEKFTAFRPYQGLIRRDMAERAALAAADLAGKQHAMRLLAKNKDLHFLATDLKTSSLPLLEGLAAQLFTTRVLVIGQRGFPPHLEAFIEVQLEAPKNIRKVLQEALLHLDLLELHALILERQATLLAEYDTYMPRLLNLTEQTGGTKEDAHKIQALVRNIDAIAQLETLLKTSGSEQKNFEDKVQQIEKLQSLAPADPIIKLITAEVLLRSGKPSEAMEFIIDSAHGLPKQPRVYDVQGAIYLYQQLPVLAADAFSEAIKLAPNRSTYYAHRASAYLIQENNTAMCADFQKACSLGDCEGYQWSITNQLCNTDKE